ncbi:MerR family regulatory protein [Leptolyngbya sp. NIES-3755]|nr:MerR family regulatory protein [Leptolyngbya sp. NIES-3755]
MSRNFLKIQSTQAIISVSIMTVTLPNVLTLEETAAYLRLSPEVVEREAIAGNIPGQSVNSTWRFLKTAIDDWLQNRDQRAVLLRQAGVFADDETLKSLQAQIDLDRQTNLVGND